MESLKTMTKQLIRMAEADVNTVPTEAMATNATRGLKYRKEFNRGGTIIGVTRANQLASRENLSPSTVRRMHSYFSRHEVDKQGQGFNRGEKGFPSAGLVAWLLWGGDAGQRWAKAKTAQLDRERKEEIREDVFTTEAEANDRAKVIGCVGSHSHDENGKLIFMPCKDHDEYTSLTGREVSSVNGYYHTNKPKKPKKPKKNMTRKEYVDALIGVIKDISRVRRKKRVSQRPTSNDLISKWEKAEVGNVKVGDMVSWNSSGGRARGKITSIMKTGKVKIPKTTITLNASEDDPVALITLYRGSEPTDTVVGHKIGTLRKL